MKRNKKGQFLKGQISWNKGKKASLVTKKRMSEAVKQQWAEGKRNRKFSEEHKRKIGKANKGKIPWIKGKHQTEEHRKKLSEARLKRKEELGYINSPETRKKISRAMKKRKLSKKALRKMAQARLRQSRSQEPTSIEKKVYDELKRRGILFETQKLINGRFVVDAYIPSLNLIVEVDGNYWHSLPKTIKKDKAENAYLTKCGYGILRLSGSEINNDSFKQKLNKEVN